MALILRLPEECISKILSVTSPGDACRMMGVSKEFQNVAKSNLVWNKFLPLDSLRILSSSSIPPFSNNMELFFLLSASILVDDGNKSFALERSTGRKTTFFLQETFQFWVTVTGPPNPSQNQECRFREVGELQSAERVEIEGKIRTETLSPNTKYGAYLVFKLAQNAYGLHSIPFETFIACGDRVLFTSTATLRHPETDRAALQAIFYGNRMQKMKERLNGGDAAATKIREDGWLEVEIGDFFVGGGGATSGSGDEIIRMGVMEIKGYQLKGGLIVEGIHVRPKS